MQKISRCALFFSILFATASVSAGGEEEARVHFRRGNLKYTEGDIDGALAEFQLAQALSPTYKLLYNIGQCYVELGRLEEAHETFTEYLSEGAADIPSDRRAEVELSLADLEKRVADGEGVAAAETDAETGRGEESQPEPAPAYVPDPRAADLTLPARPGDMAERDWFGVNERDMTRYNRLKTRRPELSLTDHLVEQSKESKGLMWGEIGAGVLTGAGAGALVAGLVIEDYDLAAGGAAGGIFFGLGLVALLIIDAVDIGTPRVLYPARLEAAKNSGAHVAPAAAPPPQTEQVPVEESASAETTSNDEAPPAQE